MTDDVFSMTWRRSDIREAGEAMGYHVDELLKFVIAAERTERAVAVVCGSAERLDRKAMRKRRRELILAGMVANGVPRWVRAMVIVGKVASWLLPMPWSLVVSAVVWAVDNTLDPPSINGPGGSNGGGGFPKIALGVT